MMNRFPNRVVVIRMIDPISSYYLNTSYLSISHTSHASIKIRFYFDTLIQLHKWVKRFCPFHLLISSYSVSKKSIATEILRQESLDRIIEQFADAIKTKGGFNQSTKTSEKCHRLGTKNGIKALMERWFLIQELCGVGLYC